MPHFMKLVNSSSMGALLLVDKDFNPIERTFTIGKVGPKRPPAGKEARPCIYLVEPGKDWFPAIKQYKRLANLLKLADTNKWEGCRVTVTCDEVRSTEGGKTMGIIVVRAERASKQASGNEPQTDTKEPDATSDNA